MSGHIGEILYMAACCDCPWQGDVNHTERAAQLDLDEHHCDTATSTTGQG